MPASALDDPSEATDAPSLPPAAPAEEDLFCPECGYNLHALEGITRCPECGLIIDRLGFARSRIPWVHRRHVGRVRAYCRTVWLATLRPKTVAAEASRRVSYPDAQRFRYVTAFVAAASVVAGLIAAMAWYGSAALSNLIGPSNFPAWAMGAPSRAYDVLIPWDAGASLRPVLPLTVLLISIFVTGVASYWFHPRGLSMVRQNRSVALSYYGCAPFSLVSIPVLAMIGVAVMKEAGLDNQANASWAVMRVLEITAAGTGLLVVGAAWRSTLSLLRNTTQPSVRRLVLAGVLIPLKWLLCCFGVGLLVPWVVGFVWLVVGSLR